MGGEPDDLIRLIREAFSNSPYPGDAYLQGSEGCDAEEAIAPFIGRTDWSTVPASLLDQHYDALSFFSEAGFRFFLPAYLIADVRRELMTADPLHHLAGSFHDLSVTIPAGGEPVARRTGPSVLVNPRRYGAIRMGDYARYRMSVFTREESAAIVEYFRWRRQHDDTGFDTKMVDAALDAFWRARAADAPTGEALARHLAEEQAFVDRLLKQEGDSWPGKA